MAPGHPSSTQAPLRRGIMFVISSPSGAGKSALSRLLLQDDPEIRLSVSVTTRPRRPSEVHGVHYHFIDVPTFHQMRERGDLLEWAEVHGNFYATPRQLVEQALGEGRDVLFDIDVQGTLQLYERLREDVVSVFILPPSIAELQSRLKRRAEDSDDVILRRLRTAETEIARWQDYDFVLVNDDLERCFHDLKQVLVAERIKRQQLTNVPQDEASNLVKDAERLKRHRQPHLPALTETLLKDLRTVLS